MQQQSSVPVAKFRFGPFEADPRTGELRKFGIRVKLQTQPFTILLALLRRPGELITREELRELIWGSETIVDFDHSLATAINKVREALSDSADRPRYIETLAKRGYRFIAPVETTGVVLEPNPAPPQSPNLEVIDLVERVSPAAEELRQEPNRNRPAPVRPKKRRLLAIAATAGAVVIAVGAWLWSTRSAHPGPVKFSRVTFSSNIYPGEIGIERFPGIATDGIRIYFPEVQEQTIVLSHASLPQGEVYPIVTPSEIVRPTVADISPDGSNLLVRSMTWSDMEQPLWVVPSSGGAAHKVRSGLAHDAAWLPDGTSIVYASGRDLFVTDNQGGPSRKLASLPGRAFWIRYSPDGSRLRFTLIDPKTRATSLWELSHDGKDLKPLLPLTGEPPAECCGAWTRDGKYYVYQSTRDGLSNIWVREEAGIWPFSTRTFQLTAGPLSFGAPAPSRSGHRLFVIGADARIRPARYDARSGKLLPYLPNINAAGRIAFSRDNRRILWVSTIDGTLWRSNIDGTERLQLTSRPMRVYMMRWSPDGGKIAFMGKKPGEPWRIYVISADGGNPTTLLETDRNQADPDWSPDGKSIVFGHTPDYMSEDSTPKPIYIVNLETKKVSTLDGSVGLFSPRWSSDGRFLAAMPLNQRKLVLFDFTTRQWSDLATRSVNNPVWSADGKFVYFQAFLEEKTPLYRVSTGDRRLELVTDFSTSGPVDIAGFWGLTPDNDPILPVRSLAADIYAIDWRER